MSNSNTYYEIGPLARSKISMLRNIRHTRDFLKLAEERLSQDNLRSAESWLNIASKEAVGTNYSDDEL